MRGPAWAWLLVPLTLLVGCASPATDRGELLTPPPAGASTTASPTGTAAASESPPIPVDLDRQLADSDDFRRQREALVSSFSSLIEDERVLAAMRAVPRHSFVPTSQLGAAYADHPLPIGYGQTISQPSLVALMTELLELEPGDRVLEIGTGSGYQAAILGELTAEVYSVEIVPPLAATARLVLDALGYRNVVTDHRDGYLGWPEHAPYDAIIVTAAPDHLPQPLVEQLREVGGRMVIPIGPVGDVQTLWLVTREGGETRMERLLDVLFVPLVRGGE